MDTKVNLNIPLEEVENLPFRELYRLYMALFNQPSKSTRKEFYLWRVLNRLQELRFGGLDAKTRTFLEEMHELPSAEKTLPIGAEIIKKFKGQTYRLRVLQDGFELDGQFYKSLSGAALAVSGRKIYGKEFWGII